MSKIRKLSLVTLACICTATLTYSAGCQKKTQTGKFTEEQMAEYGFAKRDNLPKPSGVLVLSVGEDTITTKEIVTSLAPSLASIAKRGDYNEFVNIAKPAIVKEVKRKLADILLYQAAKKEITGNIDDIIEKAVEKEVNNFVANYGNYAEAQNVIERAGMDWKQFREHQKKLILTQSFLSKKISNNQTIPRQQALEYYEQNKTEFFTQEAKFEFAIIEIVYDKLKDDQLKPEDNQSHPQAAGRIAKELIEKIRSGEDFAELAKKHSHNYSAPKGGIWDPVTPGSLEKPYDVLEPAAEKLQPGQLSEPILAEGRVLIIKLKAKQDAGFIPFGSVQDRIEVYLQLLNRDEQLNKVVEELTANTDVIGLERFINYCLEAAYLQLNPR